MALSTQSRDALIAALEGHGIRVYDTVPAVPKPPAIVITPDAPWIIPERLGTPLNYRVRWRVMVVISPRNNEAATTDIEDAVDTVIARVREVMEGAAHPAVSLSVPLVVDAGRGASWAAAH